MQNLLFGQNSTRLKLLKRCLHSTLLFGRQQQQKINLNKNTFLFNHFKGNELKFSYERFLQLIQKKNLSQILDYGLKIVPILLKKFKQLSEKSRRELNVYFNKNENKSQMQRDPFTDPNFKPENNQTPNNNNNKQIILMIIFSLVLFEMMRSMSQRNEMQEKDKLIRDLQEKEKRLEILSKTKSESSTSENTNMPRLHEPTTKTDPSADRFVHNPLFVPWDQVVTKHLPRRDVQEIHAKKSTPDVVVFFKNPVEINGVKTRYCFTRYSPDKIEEELKRVQDELNFSYSERVHVQFFNPFFITSINLLFLSGLVYLLFRGTKSMSSNFKNMPSDMFSQFTKAKFTMIDPHLKAGVPKVTFKDVAGLHEAKIEVKEFVDYLADSERFTKLGAKIPKGALLLGPPGCGKTLLAKAVATEANVPFFSVAGSEFIEMIGGLGASRVRSLFEEARKHSPSIIYIDEIDAIGRKRSDAENSGASGETDQTLNQLLVSMDGLESNSNVVVLASTNRADVLDKALLRAGRFDRHINIDLPTHLERVEILKVHMKNLKLNFDAEEKEEFITHLSHLTPRFSGADLANICNESALLAARNGQKVIEIKDFYAALERVIGGAEKLNTTMSPQDRKALAYHECGHVIVSWFHQNADLILKVSLLSRTKSNAFSQYLPLDKKLYSKEELFDQMCLYFGGRAAETLVFNLASTNAEDDLKKITKLAYAQIESFGMNDRVGNISFPTRDEEKAGGMIGQKPYSRKLRGVIDEEVRRLVMKANDQAMHTVQANLDKLHLLAEALLKRERLSFSDIVQLIGEPLNQSRLGAAKMNLSNKSTF